MFLLMKERLLQYYLLAAKVSTKKYCNILYLLSLLFSAKVSLLLYIVHYSVTYGPAMSVSNAS